MQRAVKFAYFNTNKDRKTTSKYFRKLPDFSSTDYSDDGSLWSPYTANIGHVIAASSMYIPSVSTVPMAGICSTGYCFNMVSEPCCRILTTEYFQKPKQYRLRRQRRGHEIPDVENVS
jgi:hypothetical protein